MFLKDFSDDEVDETLDAALSFTLIISPTNREIASGFIFRFF